MAQFKSLPLEWQPGRLILLDQRKLPVEEIYLEFTTHEAVARAIRDMVVRGAPSIGASAAFGYVLGVLELKEDWDDNGLSRMRGVAEKLAASRPTAVNLAWALARMDGVLAASSALPYLELLSTLEKEALSIAVESVSTSETLGRHGAEVIRDGDGVLTHCNAGALATVDYGTALGVIRAAVQAGKKLRVYADETRPFLQGARLTAWELLKLGIDVTLICDNMAGWLMKKGSIDLVVVGADRIAANGDTANKIGTYSLALLAQNHGIPFYVAAPLSTIDLATEEGEAIPIEERAWEEITHIGGVQVAPENIKCYNPAFDVTPWNYITGIITEKGIARPPYEVSLKKIFE